MAKGKQKQSQRKVSATTSRRLNVLVYSGPGTTSESVRHCLLALRRLLYPNYAVIPIGETALLGEPWMASCALLIIPGGADMAYVRILNGAGNRRISQYVRSGGRFLGLCAGGYYGSSACEFEVGSRQPGMEVVGKRELAFFPGICRGGAYRGFAYHTETGALAVPMTVHAQAFPQSVQKDLPTMACCYYNGGGVFVDAMSFGNKEHKVEVLASYPDNLDVDGGDGRAAVVYCPVGEGAALLTGPHPEFESENLIERPDLPSYQDMLDTLRADDKTQARSRFLRACLVKLGLDVGSGNSGQPHLTALHVTSLYRDEADELMFKWGEMLTKRGPAEVLQGEKDTFRVLHPDSDPKSAWPKEAVVQLAEDDLPSSSTTTKTTPFGVAMLIDLADRALRYPKLATLIQHVASGLASADERVVFRGILSAVATHEEEEGAPPATTATETATNDADPVSIDAWREKYSEERKLFERIVDDLHAAVGHSLLLEDETSIPTLDPAMRQEIWSAFVHGRHKRIGTGAEARLPTYVVDEIAGDDTNSRRRREEQQQQHYDHRLVVYEASWPLHIAAFDFGVYYRTLAAYRASDADAMDWGNQIMYAKVTTSTNTLLESNPRLVSALPTGFTFTATTQLAARGRGSNVWLAPDGQLILSTVIHHPHRTAPAPSRPVVFIQYLAAMAIVEAVQAYAPGYDQLDVRVKWPNDVYARVRTSSADKDADYVKIAGILSQAHFSDSTYHVVLGIGLNAANQRPTVSLQELVDSLDPKPTTPILLEQLLACLLTRLETLYHLFCRHGFDGDIAARYYRYWLHTDQIVTLEAVAGSPRAKVLGITHDWGLLRVAEVVADHHGTTDVVERPTGRVWQLQSDENSFDYWKGLVRTKT